MKVFISWSGSRSLSVAKLLRSWLTDVIQAVDPWLSASDIGAGTKPMNQIGQQLEDMDFGIMCLTRENFEKPWILFEAGALSKTFATSFVVPYLIDMTPSDLTGPLSQFQAVEWDKHGTRDLVESINKATPDRKLKPEQLEKSFEKSWPDLSVEFESLPEPEEQLEEKSVRDPIDIAKETLELVRQLSRTSSNLSQRIDDLQYLSPRSPYPGVSLANTPYSSLSSDQLNYERAKGNIGPSRIVDNIARAKEDDRRREQEALESPLSDEIREGS